jgi:hypothetical protein
MVTTRHLKLGLVIFLLVFALIVAALISSQHMSIPHTLAATMVEYAKVAGPTAIEY